MDSDEITELKNVRYSSSIENLRSGGRRPGEKVLSPEQPQKKKIREDKGDSRGRSTKSSHSHSSSKISRNEPMPSTSKDVTFARSDSNVDNKYEKNGGGGNRKGRFFYEIVESRPSSITSKSGRSGEPINLKANFFKLLTRPKWNIFQYHVTFSPEIESRKIRQGILSEKKSEFGGYLFDGSHLYVISKLPNDITEFTIKSKTNVLYKVVIKYVKVVLKNEWQSLQVLNLILRRAMGGLKLELVGRNLYDPQANINISEYKLQLWPGYITSIRQYEKDILICSDISHKVMRSETVYDLLKKCYRESRNAEEEFKSQVIGTIILTQYNNKTYKINDVDFNSNPLKTFSRNNKNTSLIEYYYEKYNIRIQDKNQPLLVSTSKIKNEFNKNDLILLIPELCQITGLNTAMRQNFRLGKLLSQYTQMKPDKRLEKLDMFNRRLQKTESSMKVLENWDMKLDSKVIDFKGRVLKPENIVFGTKKVVAVNGNWTKELRGNKLFTTIELKRWILVFQNRNQREANDLVQSVIKAGTDLGMSIRRPVQYPISDDRISSYINAIESCAKNDPQLIMFITPNNNSERYASIKKKTCIDRAIPTQIVLSKTCNPQRGGLMSIATKIAIQLNCKLGAIPWMVELPLSGLMTIGYDICKDSYRKAKAYGALVATMDMKKERGGFFSTVSSCHVGDSLSNELTINVAKALKEYHLLYGALPNRILFYRDGVGEGQLKQIFEYEIKTLLDRLNSIYKDANHPNGPKLAYIVVSKSTNTKIFSNNSNPPNGTVVDDVITFPESYDFYLVSQASHQGTVTPTLYNVLYDNMGLDPDRLQILTYKQTHLYYNWLGTTCVPAVCQFAKKLAAFCGQHIQQIPSNALEKNLYFL